MSLFFTYEPQHATINDGSAYADYVDHCRAYREMWVKGSKTSTAHECTHGIHSEVRLANGVGYTLAPRSRLFIASPSISGLYGEATLRLPRPQFLAGRGPAGSANHNAFYVGRNRAIVLPEPSIRLSHVAAAVPKLLRGWRYSTYLVEQQRYWEDMALYVFDEWCAYQAGADAGLDLVKRRTFDEGKVDLVAGAMEFNLYATALMVATAKTAPRDLDALLPFYKFAWRRGWNIYHAGKDQFAFDEQFRLEREIRDGAAGDGFRSFLKEHGLHVPAGVEPDPDDGGDDDPDNSDGYDFS